MTMAKTVYLLSHVHELSPDQEDLKIIGVYSSEATARAAEARAKLLPGFKRHPDGFNLDPHTLDEDNWLSGFVTMHLRPPVAPKKAGRKKAKHASRKAKSAKKSKPPAAKQARRR